MSMLFSSFLFLLALLQAITTGEQSDFQEYRWVHSHLSSMSQARSDHGAVVVNGTIYTIGGCTNDQQCPATSEVGVYCECTEITSSGEMYNITTNTWSDIVDAPRLRYRHGMVSVGNKIYLIGGRDLSDNIVEWIDIYDITTGNWLNSTQGPQVSDHAVVAMDGIIYVIGGYDLYYQSQNTVWSYDTTAVNATWNSTNVPSLYTPRGDLGAVVLENRIYVFGGYNDDFCRPSQGFESWSVGDATWVSLPYSTYGRGDKAMVALPETGDILIIGGEQKNIDSNGTCDDRFAVPIREIEGYNIATQKWYNLTDIPDERFRFVAIEYNGRIFILGGQGPIIQTVENGAYYHEVLDTLEEFLPDNAYNFHANSFNFFFLPLFLFFGLIF